ncbi:MAG: hypothetical protein IKE74_04630 [Mogibacterium sp.]|nr:hypothetical protein [Mogibacterium sp.]
MYDRRSDDHPTIRGMMLQKTAAGFIAVVMTMILLISSVASYAEDDHTEPAAPAAIELRVMYKSGRALTLEWTGPKYFADAASCFVYRNGSEEGTEVSLKNDEESDDGGELLRYTYTDLEYNTLYTFRAAYFDENGNEIKSSDVISAMSAVAPPQKRMLGSFTVRKPPRLLKKGAVFNLRKYAKEPHNGYAIVQGSCIDNRGEYSYYCLVDNGNYGKLVKVRMSDNICAGVSRTYRFAHGNGMCFDSKRNKVVVASYDNGRRTLTFVDPDNLNNIYQKNVTFPSSLRNRVEGNATGITALAYNAKYDCYLAMQRRDRNIIIYDAETLKAKAAALTVFESSYTGCFQSVDADDTYVYFLLSPYGSGQLRNILVAFDWHAENYEELLNGNSEEDVWLCGPGNGRCSAVIRITGAAEIESLFHTDAGGGKGHFYLTNYDTDPKYTSKKVKWKKVKKKVKVKVKWKKVKKKVKWKKVKTKKGKIKWKYKYKKVWKYKYKYKTKKVWKYRKVKVFSYYNRDNYVMDLGVF